MGKNRSNDDNELKVQRRYIEAEHGSNRTVRDGGEAVISKKKMNKPIKVLLIVLIVLICGCRCARYLLGDICK